MAVFYAVLFALGDLFLIIGTGLLCALHLRLTTIQKMIAEQEVARRFPSEARGIMQPMKCDRPAVFRRAYDGAITNVRGMTTEEALKAINLGAAKIRRYGRSGDL